MRKLTLLFLPLALIVACDDTPSPATPGDASMPERVALSGQLSQADALKATNKNISSLVPCAQAAKDGAAVELRLSWSVLPDGKVSKIDIKAVDGAVDDTLKTCITTAMEKWAFPASEIGTRIEEIPLKVGG